MRISMVLLALGFVFGAPIFAPTSFVSEAVAQQTVEEQVVPVAQAGDISGLTVQGMLSVSQFKAL